MRRRGIELKDLIEELKEQEAEKKDYICPASSLFIRPDGEKLTLVMGNNEFSMTDLFHRQLASVLDIPARYYHMMQFNKPKLLAENVNAWLSTTNKNYMIRTISGKARAFLSDRYRRIDNLEVVSAVFRAVEDVEDLEDSDFNLLFGMFTDNRLYLGFVSNRERKCVDDRIRVGFVLSNSEVGLGAVSIRVLLYTFACSNGR